LLVCVLAIAVPGAAGGSLGPPLTCTPTLARWLAAQMPPNSRAFAAEWSDRLAHLVGAEHPHCT
jgi:hypothetical protein